jgi:HK97 family phage portal protein
VSFIGFMAQALTNRAAVPFVSTRNSLGSLFRSDDKLGQMQAMGSVGTLFAIVDALSTDISQVEWKLYRKQRDNRRRYGHDGQDERVEVLDHMALRVWNRPSPFMTGQEMVQVMEQHRLLTGESWLQVIRPAGIPFPTGLMPIRPDRMEPVPDPEKYLVGYMYRSPDGEKIPLELDDILFSRTPNPVDSYRGWGAVQSIMADLDATKASAEYNRMFFRNSAAPGGVIHVPEEISDPELQRLRAQWDEGHRGTHNAHRPTILTAGMTWENVAFTQRDMQFAELRKVSGDVIREAFCFPVARLGTSESVNRANAEAFELMYSRWLIKTALNKIKQMLNSEFLPMFGSAGEGVEFDFENPVPDDQELEIKGLTAKADAYAALVGAGADPELVCEYLCIPDLGHIEPPEPAPAIMPSAPAEQPAGDEPVPAALNGHKVRVWT